MGACLKCGKETLEKAAFCEECQEDMSRYPVKPGTVIHLPKRQTLPEKKTELYQEEDKGRQVIRLQRIVRVLLATVALLSVLLMIMAFMLIRTLTEDKQVAPIGRNYTTVDTSHQP